MEPRFEFAFAVTLTLKKPRLEMAPLAVGGSRLGVQIVGGTFEGPQIAGTVVPGGGEWPHVRGDDVFCFDARYHLRVDDGTIILLQNRGYRHASPEVMERLWALRPGDHVSPEEYYFRCTPTFEVAPGKHDWLARHVFVGLGERNATGNTIRYFRML
ncbi:hypothetical protein AB7M35_000140 [Amorphus suaedae]